MIFFIAVGALAAKLLIFDLTAELNRAESQLASKEAYLEEQLEETVFQYKDTEFTTLSITDDLVSIEFIHPNLEEATGGEQ